MKLTYHLNAALFLCVFLGTGTIHAATVDYQPPELSITANDEPMTSVLRTIAKKMNISISYSVHLDKHVTCHIEKLPVQRAFRNLLGNDNFALQWEDKHVVGLSILQQGMTSSQTTTIQAAYENQDIPADAEMDRETAAEMDRVEKEAAAEEARIEQEMMDTEH